MSLLIVLMVASVSRIAGAQTPASLQEWQYTGGVILARLFESELPEFRSVVGLAANVQAAYDGSRADRVEGGPVIDVQYRDIAFASTGAGVGYNVFRGDHYQAGVSMGYDFGRRMKDDLGNLHGLGNIGAAPVAKLYGTWVISKSFPIVLRLDGRQFIGGAQGAIADAAFYIPLPGSSATFVMFAGPSVSFATRHYKQTLFGVTPAQSLASGHPVYVLDTPGMVAAGIGVSAVKFLDNHWLLSLNGAVSQIRGDAARSPLVERKTQRQLAVSVNYQF